MQTMTNDDERKIQDVAEDDDDKVAVSPVYHPGDIKCTNSLFLFLYDYKKVLDNLFFVVTLSTRMDQASQTINKVLGILDENEKRDSVPPKTFDRLKEFATLTSRNIVTNVADGFLWYLSDVIQRAMRRRPEIVKSGQTIKIEEVFDFKSRREMINYLIDRKINSLSYGGMNEIEKFIDDSLGISMFDTDDQRAKMKVLIESRNVLVHNRGVINSLFIKRIDKAAAEEFKDKVTVYMGFDRLLTYTGISAKTAVELDEKIAKKFRLETKALSVWQKEKDDRDREEKEKGPS